MAKPVCILWMNEAAVYEQALARADLAERFELHAVRADAPVPAELASRCNVLLGWRPAPDTYQSMPRLAWVQSVTAGMDQWLAAPGLRDGIVLTCARGSHRVQMPVAPGLAPIWPPDLAPIWPGPGRSGAKWPTSQHRARGMVLVYAGACEQSSV